MARKYLPLAPVGTPGIWSSLANMVPTRCGSYYPGNQFVAIATPALSSPGTTNRAWCALLNDDSVVGYVGTTTKIYTYDGATTFTDKTRGAGVYTGSLDWNFCQFGNVTLASNRADAVQFRDASTATAFADLAGAPKARILVTQSFQVLAFDINDGAEKRNAFATCAPGDYTDWSSANATTATAITHRPGKITAAIAFRDYVLVFKQSSVYKLTYTGSATYKWRVELIAVGKGAWGPYDVVSTGDVVIFSGPGGAWKFDGANLISITDGVGQFTASASSWYSPRSGNVHLGQNVYNVVSDAWGIWPHYTTASSGVGVTALLTGEPAAMNALAPATAALPDYTLGFDAFLNTGKAWGSSSYYQTVSNVFGFICGLVTGVEGIGGRKQTKFGGADLETTISITRSSDIGGADTAYKLYSATANNKDAYALSDVPLFAGFFSGAALLSTSSTNQHRFDFQTTAPYGRFLLNMGAGYIEVLDLPLNMTESGAL